MQPPPPKSVQPTPQSTPHLNTLNYASSGAASSSGRSAGQSQQDQRRPPVDSLNPAPPIVVVSSDTPSDAPHRPGHLNSGQDRLGAGPDHTNGNVPRNSTLNRLRAGPKDTIPMVGKPPRKQRSSRFVVTEKVEIERLPPFMGSCSFSISSCHLATSSSWPNQRHLPPSGHSYSSRSFINVASCSISTMPALNSKANKLKHRLYTRCSSILPLNAVSSPRMYTQRSSAW